MRSNWEAKQITVNYLSGTGVGVVPKGNGGFLVKIGELHTVLFIVVLQRHACIHFACFEKNGIFANTRILVNIAPLDI